MAQGMNLAKTTRQKLSAGIIRLRVPILALTGLITLVLGFFLKDLKINPDILSYLPEQDPVAQLNTYVGEKFGGSHLAIVALEAEDVFSLEMIGRIHHLTSELRGIEGVQSVISLTNVLDIKKVEDTLEVGKLIDPDRLPEEDSLADLRAYALGKPMFRGRLVSADGRATVILCRLREEADKARAAQDIRRLTLGSGALDEAGLADDGLSADGPGKEDIGDADIGDEDRVDKVGERVYFAGLPFQLLEINQLVLQDIIRLIPLAALLIMIVLYLGFGNLRGMLLPLLVAGIGSVWTLGIMSLFGVSFSVISNIIPVVLIAVGSAYSIHVISRINEQVRQADSSGTAKHLTGEGLSKIALPVLLAALTTIAGFISFIFSTYLTMIRDFGIFSSLGILFSLILSLTFLPALLSLLPMGEKQSAPAGRRGKSRAARHRGSSNRSGRSWRRDLLSGLLWRGIKKLTTRHSRLILLVSAGLLVVSLLGIPRMQRAVDLTAFFKRGTEIRRAEQLLKDKFGGSTTLEILVQGDLRDPAVLVEMKALESFLRSHPGLHNPHSIVELIEEMNFAFSDRREIPDSRDKVANLWFLLEGEEMLAQLVNDGQDEGVIRATVQSLNARQVSGTVRAVEGYIASVGSESCTFRLAGSIPIYHQVDRGIRRSLVQSLGIAVLLVLLCNIILLRSVIGGFLGILPIAVTLIMLFGIMGWGGIPLDVATVLIGSISLGIGIDYSIHFLSRFRREWPGRSAGNIEERAEVLGRVLSSTGKAILINLLTVSAGFLTLRLGTLIPLKHFGLLIAVTMLCSGLSTLLLLPAVIALSPARLLGSRNTRLWPLATNPRVKNKQEG